MLVQRRRKAATGRVLRVASPRQGQGQGQGHVTRPNPMTSRNNDNANNNSREDSGALGGKAAGRFVKMFFHASAENQSAASAAATTSDNSTDSGIAASANPGTGGNNLVIRAPLEMASTARTVLAAASNAASSAAASASAVGAPTSSATPSGVTKRKISGDDMRMSQRVLSVPRQASGTAINYALCH